MPKNKLRPPDRHAGDDTATTALITWLLQNNIYFVRFTRYHLKVEGWNYYIGKGTIFRDGELSAEAERGIEAFKRHVDRLSFIQTGGSDDFVL